MLKFICPLVASLAAFLPLSVTGAQAQGFTVVEDVVQLHLLPGWRTESGSHMAALRVDLAPGWKTYWRSPGEGGIPPVFDWTASQNVGGVEFHWPTPTAFDQLGLQSIGYKTQLILPMEFTPVQADAAISVNATVQIGVCEDICIPVSIDFHAELPTTGAVADPVIRTALANRPATATEAGLRSISCTLEPISDGLRVTAQIDLPDTGGPEAVVFESSDTSLWISEAKVTRNGGVLSAAADLVPETGQPFVLDRSSLRLTIVGQTRAVDLHGCPAF